MIPSEILWKVDSKDHTVAASTSGGTCPATVSYTALWGTTDIVVIGGLERGMGQSKNLAIVRAVIDQHLSTAQAAARFGVSRQWVNALLRRYRESGPAALAPGSRAPHSPAVRTPEVVTERIIALRRSLGVQGADNGAETIAWHLEQEGSPAPSRSTIHRILRTAGLVTDQPAKRPRSSYHRFEADTPNETWQADITHWFLTNGTRVEILDFLDDHSRYLLLLKAQAAFTGGDVVACMQALISTFGPPASTLTDNGLVFTSRLTGHPGARNGFEVKRL